MRRKTAIVFLATLLSLGTVTMSKLKIDSANTEVSLPAETVSVPYNYLNCVVEFGIGELETSRCNTDDGRTYTEFRPDGLTFEECVKNGGKVSSDEWGCVGEDRKYIENYKYEVYSYSECQALYENYSLTKIIKPYECVDKNGLIYVAGGENRSVNSFSECVDNLGQVTDNSFPPKCYYDEIVYWQPAKGNAYLNPPLELKTFTDCVRPGFSLEVDGEELSCTAFNGKKYYYTGPAIETYEDCVRVMSFTLTSNPPQCYGPDGKHYIGTRSED